MVYDAHVHYIPAQLAEHTSFYKGVWADKEKLFTYLKENQIEKALLTYPSTDAYLKIGTKKVCQIYNQAQQELIKESPKIITVALLDLEDLDKAKKEVASLRERGFKAINLPSSYQGKFLVKELVPLFKEIEKYDLPVFVHPQTINPIGFERVKDPLLMPVLEYCFESSMFMGLLMTEGILQNFKVKFIFSSLAGVAPFLKNRFDRVYQMLRKRKIVKDLNGLPSSILKKVYVDTSGASLENMKMALNLFGAERLLWGSDYPVNSPVKDNLKELDKLGAKLKNKITSGNFLKLFNL